MSKKILVAVVLLAMASQMCVAAWTDNISMKGDLRYRHEMIDQEGRDARTRHRVRARVELKGTASDELTVGIRLASGSDDPVSTNQTLDNGFSSKGINLDKAYFDWHPEALLGVNILGGKMGKPWVIVNDLVWDGDLNPEGLAAKMENKMDDATTLMVNIGGFWVDERSSDDDTMLYTGQVALQMDMGAKVLVGAGYYGYEEIQGNGPVFDGDAFGNSTMLDANSNAVHATEYKEVEVFAKVDTKMDDTSVSVYGQYVVNTDADANDTGYLVGVGVKQGKWKLAYDYRELEQDAVLGVFTDSDSFGGGTDGRGHRVSGGYKIAKNWDLGVTYFMNEQGITDGGAENDYNRLQIDLKTKF